jgi:membrane protease YdiL (CAAX protease family)
MVRKIPVVPWSPAVGIIFVIFGFFATQVAAGLLVSIYPLLKHWSVSASNNWLTNSVTAQFIFIVLAEGFSLLAVYGLLRVTGATPSVIGLRRPKWSDLFIGIAAVPVYYVFLFAILAAAKVAFPNLNLNQEQQLGFNDVTGTLPLVMTFISLVVLPPIVEEILVRGVLYGTLKKVLPIIWAAIVTSALFAAAHLPEGGASGPLYVAAVDTFTLSMVLIWLRERSGGLWACITLHAIKNGIAFVALFVLGVH